jgi:hypothetical protein
MGHFFRQREVLSYSDASNQFNRAYRITYEILTEFGKDIITGQMGQKFLRAKQIRDTRRL